MKYMGSKKVMLNNGLGEILIEQSYKCDRFFDPFCGSAVVSWYVAENTEKKVRSGDLQKYSVDLANSILLRNKSLNVQEKNILNEWLLKSEKDLFTLRLDIPSKLTKKFVSDNKKWSSKSSLNITNAYGGHYFSYNQAITFDVLLKNLPYQETLLSIAIASLIEAASMCVASPGHTAQPFGTTVNGLKAIIDAWKRDPFFYIARSINSLSERHAKSIGNGFVREANILLEDLKEGDLVFLDPPYSGVHYSRFYHVLETISRNERIFAAGKGRYPAPDERPRSNFSLRGKSKIALDELLSNIAKKRASAILTFPVDECSNGLNGTIVKEISGRYFKVTRELIKGEFSTLGGNNDNRPARQPSAELVLILEPK